MHKILTLDQLADFCEKNKFYSFDSNESGYKISVQVPGIFELNRDTSQGLLFTRLKVCHTLLNRNKTFISEENMKKAMPSLKYRPILGYIHQLDNGEYDFHSHDMEIIVDENGKEKIKYKEQQIGTFTADEPFLEYDSEADKTYVIANGVIPEEYTLASEIIKRKNGTKVSCELCIDSFSYNAKEKYLELIDFYFLGCTALGCEKDGSEIGEGMLGSRLDIMDFSMDNNSVYFNIIEDNKKILEDIKNTLNKLSAYNKNKEGGKNTLIIDELLAKYNKTIEDIDFEYENMTDEELEAKFEELFGEHEISSLSVSIGDVKYDFDLSLNDTISALSILVNNTYSSDDNEYYSVVVYDNYVVMIGWYSGQAYRQDFKEENSNFTLVGERVSVTARYLTDEEEKALDDLEKNYELTSEELSKYRETEIKNKKAEIINSEEFNLIKTHKEFNEIKENAENMSLEEVQKACDDLLLKYVKNNSANENPVISKGNSRVNFNIHEEDKPETLNNPYGNIFKN